MYRSTPWRRNIRQAADATPCRLAARRRSPVRKLRGAPGGVAVQALFTLTETAARRHVHLCDIEKSGVVGWPRTHCGSPLPAMEAGISA